MPDSVLSPPYCPKTAEHYDAERIQHPGEVSTPWRQISKPSGRLSR